MKILVATDAWRPQVNGVVRTLGALARGAGKLGVEIEFLSPEGFWTFPVPTYPGLRLALPGRKSIAARIERARPDAIHVATEGPIGFAVRGYCMRAGRPFTTATPRDSRNISPHARLFRRNGSIARYSGSTLLRP
jgi:hypothetical protein